MTSSWRDARIVWQNLEADSVMIKEENQFVNNLMKESGSDRVWIGIQRNTQDKKLYWIDSSPAYRSNFTYTNWYHNQPDNHQNQENCGRIYLDAQWNRPCHDTT